MSTLTVLDIYQNYYSYDENVDQEARKPIKPERELLPLSTVVKMFEDEIDKKKNATGIFQTSPSRFIKKTREYGR